MTSIQTKLTDCSVTGRNGRDSYWGKQDIISVHSVYSRTTFDLVYCPVCGQVYTRDNFYERIRKGYNEKQSMFLICKRCVERINKERITKNGEYPSDAEAKLGTKIGRVSLDPFYGLNLYENEAELMLQEMAEGKTLEEIRADVEDFRKQIVGKTEHISKKTLQIACYRIVPILYREVVDCNRPQIIDTTLVMDTFYFTRMRYDLTFIDDDYLVKRDYSKLSATILIGENSKGLFGFGMGQNEYESSKRCVSMALKYTSSMLPRCSIKFDGSSSEERALLEVGIPEGHLISVPKSVCKSYINPVEGAIRALRSLGLGKRAYSLPLSIFIHLTIHFINWNLFQEHVLFDGRWKGRIAELLQIDAPKDWGTLIKNGWHYIISDGELFRKYYPKFNRGPRKEKQIFEVSLA